MGEYERLSDGEWVLVDSTVGDSVAVLVGSNEKDSVRDRSIRVGDVVTLTVSSAVVAVRTAVTRCTAPRVAKNDGLLSCMYISRYSPHTLGSRVIVVVYVFMSLFPVCHPTDCIF